MTAVKSPVRPTVNMEGDASLRPNIRIEIQNNIMESMDVDGGNASDGEEGEILDSTELEMTSEDITFNPKPTNSTDRVWPKEDITHDNKFSKQHLQELHSSLGIESANESTIHFNSLHLHGVEKMSTDDIMQYFAKYGPESYEWISENSCNVLWTDKMTAARALYYLTKAVGGMPSVATGEEVGKSILLKNKNREVEMQQDDDVEKENVHISDITIDIPAGYWRLGHPHKNTEFILIRYTSDSDPKPSKSELFSEYYKRKIGIEGLISKSRKQQLKGIFERNREIESPEDVKSNPWGGLAKNWYEDARYGEPDFRVKTPAVSNEEKSSNLQNRLGFKRAHKIEEEVEIVEEVIEKKTKLPRMKMYADEEEEKIKRRRQLNALRTVVKSESKGDDLRNMLRLPKKAHPTPVEVKIEPVDLGSRLKNRKIKVAREREILVAKRRDIRSRLANKTVERRRYVESDYEEELDDNRTNSKVTVVIKKQKAPAVASTVWSRMHNETERMKTVSEGKLRVRRDSSTSVTTSDSSDSESEPEVVPEKMRSRLDRPGFSSNLKSRLNFNVDDHKSPLRIEINNDHFRK